MHPLLTSILEGLKKTNLRSFSWQTLIQYVKKPSMSFLEGVSLFSAFCFFITLALVVVRQGTKEDVVSVSPTQVLVIETSVLFSTEVMLSAPTATAEPSPAPTPTPTVPISTTSTATATRRPAFTPTPTPTTSPSATSQIQAQEVRPAEETETPTPTETPSPTDAVAISIPPCLNWLLEVTDENYETLQNCYTLMLGNPPPPNPPPLCPPAGSPWLDYPGFSYCRTPTVTLED